MLEISQPGSKSESLSLSEMLRIMDVATEMRSRRETVEKEFAIDETKRLLREKLLQTTEITGERVTPAEVDSAIESYFSTLYTYREPKGSFAVTLANLYVRRAHLAIVIVLALTLAGTGWWLMHMAATKFSRPARSGREAVRSMPSIGSHSSQVRSIAGELEEPVITIQSRHAVRLGHCRIVECRIDEVHQRVVRFRLSHNRLADVNDLGRVRTEAMNSEHFERFAMKQNLQHTRRLTRNLRAGDALEMGMTDFIRYGRFRQFPFRLSERTDFWTGVNPGGDIQRGGRAARLAIPRFAKQVTGRVSSLVVGGTRQRGRSNHIPNRINVRNARLQVSIDGDIAALVGRDSRNVQSQAI